MRTFKEFRKEMVEAHDCEKCHGKIFAVTLDALGVTRCSYCSRVVNYPRPTEEERNEWMKEEKHE